MTITPSQIAAGAKVAKTIFDAAVELKERSISSITEFSKDSNIIMRLYVDQALANEDVMPSLSSMLNQMVTGYIITAIGMSDVVGSGKTVRQLMKQVATENFVEVVDIINEFGEEQLDAAIEDMSFVDAEKEASKLYCGRVVEVKLSGGDIKNPPKLYLYIQLLPYLLPQEVMNGFIKLNFSPTWERRLRAYKAGEIRFWADLIKETDRVAERGRILKADKTGILREMEDHKASSIGKQIKGIFGASAARHNAANVIIVADAASFNATAVEAGINLNNYKTRQQFFKSSMSTMLVLVDTNYATIDLYLCGIESHGTYSFNMIKAKSGNDSLDLKSLLTLMSQGNMPRF